MEDKEYQESEAPVVTPLDEPYTLPVVGGYQPQIESPEESTSVERPCDMPGGDSYTIP